MKYTMIQTGEGIRFVSDKETLIFNLNEDGTFSKVEKPKRQGNIAVGNGIFASVSDEDWMAAYSACPWNYRGRGCVEGYINRKYITLHAFIFTRMDLPLCDVIDHIDRDPLNCCRYNLRAVTFSVNSRNAERRRTNDYHGLTRTKNGEKWIAQIRIFGTVKHLGCFDCEVEAAEAYDKAAIEHHGAFAQLNFPNKAQMIS